MIWLQRYIQPMLDTCNINQARRLGGVGGFGRTARTQAKVRGAEADADLSKISSADTIYVVAYRLA